MDAETLLRQLRETFVIELDDLVGALNRDLLALEQGPPPARVAELVHSLFRTAHTIKGGSRAANLSLVEALSHRVESLLSSIREGQRALDPELVAALFLSADAFADAVRRIRAGDDDRALIQKAIAELDARAPVAVPAEGPRSRAFAADGGVMSSPHGDDAVRVATSRVDALLVRTGELMMAQRRVDERAAELDAMLALADARGRDATLRQALSRFTVAHREERRTLATVVGEVVAGARRLGLVPFSDACLRLERVVRDVAQSERKEVDLVIDGGDRELDRAVVERLRDPLLHLVRNAVDHGVETPEARAAHGKPRRAQIRVSIVVRGGEAEISVADDGRGVDLAALRAELVRRGVTPPDDERELVRMILLPGVSTRRFVSDVSGRGVGLDVVRQELARMGGRVEVTFVKGSGTTFAITVPVSLTSLRVLLVRSGTQIVAFAASAVQRLVRFDEAALRSAGAVDSVDLAGVPTRVASLARLLAFPDEAEPTKTRRAVVVGTAPRTVALLVDELLAEQEVLVKGLGGRLELDLVSGASILPNGQVALIVSADELVEQALGDHSAGPGRRTPPAEAARKTVLLVDDSMTTRGLERSILEAAGYRVLAAANGAEGLRLLEEQGADILVSDIEMPVMDGVALTVAVRASRRFHDLPVVLVTALSSDADRQRGLAAGANAYLIKSSFDQSTLLETLARLL